MRNMLLTIVATMSLGACVAPQPDPRMSDPRFANAHYRCQMEYQKVFAATPGVGAAAHINGSNVYDACMHAEGFNR